MRDYTRYKLRKAMPKILSVLAVILLLTALFYILLFRINSFSLCVTPVGDPEQEIACGETYRDPGAEIRLCGSRIFREGIKLDIPAVTQGTVDFESPGVYELRYDSQFLFWSGDASRTVLVVDKESPVITLLPDSRNSAIYGEAYREEGYTAFDPQDGDLTDRVIREERDGSVIYSVSDSAGNTTQVVREIKYYDPIPPQLTLLGEQTVYLYAGESFLDPGFHAVDNYDGDITAQVVVEGSVDSYCGGTYELRYSVSDSGGNMAEAVRRVIVMPVEKADYVSPGNKIIYLTFDDGPGPWTEDLLDVLKEYDVKATFFVINSEYIPLVERMVKEGHSVGIHSVTHDYREIYSSPDAYFDDVTAMQAIIEDHTAVTTMLVRFPGGSSNTVSCFNEGIMSYLTKAVEDCGFRYFDWNVDSNDAGGASDAQEVYDNVIQGVKKNNISVVLQHDTKRFSVEAVERIIQWGRANGYTFLPLEMTSPMAHHGVNN